MGWKEQGVYRDSTHSQPDWMQCSRGTARKRYESHKGKHPPPRSRTDRIARAEAYLLGELVSKADVVGLQVHHAVGLGVGEDCERKARQCQYDKKRQAK